MPDGAARGHGFDGRLVRRVRLGLIAWSGGSTLAVLLVLGAVVYWSVASTLASSSEQLLRARASLVGSATVAGAGVIGSTGPGLPGIGSITGGTTIVAGSDASLPGFAVDGPYTGTLAVVVPIDGVSGLETPPAGTGATPGAFASPPSGGTDAPGPPDPSGFSAAQAGAMTLRETTYAGNPVRVLSIPLPGPAGAPSGVLQIVGDRTAELRTLGILAAVLLVGGLLAVAAATAVGWLYATRALVPIRASLRRQREFAADTSHELRTPLAVIRAGVARARQQTDARVADVGATLDAVDAEAVRLGALVDDLLALARTDAGSADLDLGAADLADVTADAMAPLGALAAERGTRLELDVAPSPMRGDAVRLRRLVTVLVDNAVRHGRVPGTVRVTVRPGRLIVDDDGPGIAAGDRGRVFERFWRGSDAAAGGSGLGLAIGAWIVDRHGGTIEVGTSPAGGARFDVRLPAGTGGTGGS